MRKFLFLLALLCIKKSLHAQQPFIYSIKADSVKITNTCDTAELVIENHTQNVPGFLFNKGRGRTEFRKVVKLNDSTLIIGGDTIIIQGNVSAANGLQLVNKQVQLGGPLTQSVTTINGNGNKMVVLDSLSLFSVNSDSKIGKLGVNIDPSSLGSAVFGAKANSSNNAFFRFYNTLGGTRFALDLVNDEGRFDMQDNNGITNIRLQANGTSYFKSGYVGIGTNSPEDRLHISGTARITDTLKMPNVITKSDTSSYKPMIVDANGNVFKMNSWNISSTRKSATVTGSSYTVPADIDVVFVNYTGGQATITLPTGTLDREITIKNLHTSNTVIISGLDTSESNSIATRGAITVKYTGSVWVGISKY
ncbi:hypothetical protein [Niastella caeni]|uniref:hypothetical protein n=1 Tax=Niastella caeni TaxID=2569763 RepID=UPI001AA08760|nr:hypothetical protein [Niastella caeni]